MQTKAQKSQMVYRDRLLICGRIDGIREALEMIRSPFSRSKIERLLEERISKLMNYEG